jgi:hypothetical protein
LARLDFFDAVQHNGRSGAYRVDRRKSVRQLSVPVEVLPSPERWPSRQLTHNGPERVQHAPRVDERTAEFADIRPSGQCDVGCLPNDVGFTSVLDR